MMSRRNVILTALVLGSLMSCNVVWAESIDIQNKHQIDNSHSGLWYITEDAEYDSISILNSSNKFNNNSWTSAIYLDNAVDMSVKGSGSVLVENFTGYSNYNVAGLAVSGMWISVPGNNPEPSLFSAANLTIKNIYGENYNGSGTANNSVAGIEIGSGGRVSISSNVTVSNVFANTKKDAYGINAYSHSNSDRPAVLKFGSGSIQNINANTSDDGNAYGFYGKGAQVTIDTDFFVSDIISLKGNAVGINTIKHPSNKNDMDESFVLGNLLSVNNVKGLKSALGINILDSKFKAPKIKITNISSDNMATGFSIKQANAENIDTAYINLDGTSEDYTGLQNDVKKVAVMADAGGNVKMTNSTNGNYGIYGALVASGDGISAGNIDLNGANTVIKGDVFAVNGGKANITLNGVNSLLEGQVDDYFNMGGDGPVRSTNLYDSEGIEKTIATSGSATINLNGGTWMARGRSVVSELAFDNAGGLVDITKDIGASITTKKLSGNGMFKMNLNASVDRANNNMLYVSDSFTGTHKIDVVLAGNAESINETNKVRFATVNGTGTFEAGTVDGGVFNLGYTVGTDKYDKNSDDSKYNGVDNGDGTYKPGEKYVDVIFDGATNWYLTGVKKEEKSDAGKTIINMSRSNYKNAVYMDRLNKRMGEARYIDGDEGLWVRMRHDRIGMGNAFRSSNTAYEIGYDRYQVNDGGEHRIGMAFDYMKGDTSYDDIFGEGETKRVGFWAYNTWLGDNGHYSDYVAKWGHLSNEFDITAKTTGEDITGDYSNNVFSLSAEYGRKKDIGNDWYIEPQVQLQFVRVTDAEYMTSQNTAVELDGYNSLIGRLGFRLGKNMNAGGECQQNVYVKADLLHEFMAEQDISAADKTGTLHESFENEGTWYDLGIGYSVKMNKDSYMYVDFEKSFGNDNDETYQINVGANWAF